MFYLLDAAAAWVPVKPALLYIGLIFNLHNPHCTPKKSSGPGIWGLCFHALKKWLWRLNICPTCVSLVVEGSLTLYISESSRAFLNQGFNFFKVNFGSFFCSLHLILMFNCCPSFLNRTCEIVLRKKTEAWKVVFCPLCILLSSPYLYLNTLKLSTWKIEGGG